MEDEKTTSDYGEKIIQFGNWIVTTEEIYWGGETNFYTPILIGRLIEKYIDNDLNKYDWPIHLVSKQWLTEDDLKDFNLAFIFALDYFHKITFEQSGKIWKTLEYQKLLIEERKETKLRLE